MSANRRANLRWRVVVGISALIASGTACSSSASSTAEPATTTVPATTVPATTAPATTAPVTTTSPPCPAPPFLTAGATQTVPPALASTLTERITDARFDGVTISASVWMEDYGEVVGQGADTALLPASNQKLLTALGAMMLLPSDGSFTTEIRASGAAVDGVVQGDVFVVAGGDPSLTRTGPNSLDSLARQLRDTGVRTVTGSIVVDVSRHEVAQTAAGWQDWQIPEYAGPLSAFVVEDNRYRSDAAYLAEPALANGEVLRDALSRHGVAVGGAVVPGTAPRDGVVLASTTSPPFSDLLARMLLRSDNEDAEMFVREIAHRANGFGTTAAGVSLAERAIENALCVDLSGRSGDGSGLSREDFRSARELRIMLQAALASSWGPELDAALPVAGQTGTLRGRFVGTAADGNLRAKTGSIIGGRALTGHLRSASGRHVVFSILVNGEGSPAALEAIDALVVALAADVS